MASAAFKHGFGVALANGPAVGGTQHQRRLVVSALAALVPCLCAGPAAAQRGVAGPIYERNINDYIPGAEGWLRRLEDQGWLLRGQTTVTGQARPAFRSRPDGDGVLTSRGGATSTQSVDLVLGRRLWDGAELIAVPSLARGFGLSDSRGIGAGLNGEAFHGGSAQVTQGVSRLFLRHTFDLSYDAYGQDDDPMRFAAPLALRRISVTVGKFAAWDLFDNNRYAHDARTQFLSWGLVGAAAVDFAGDAAGFTNGAALEWENGAWAVRAGLFQVAREAGGDRLDSRIGRAWQGLAQVDRAWWWGRYRGVARVLGGASRTRSARWSDLAAGLREGDPDPDRGRAFRTKAMAALNVEQALNDSLGIFMRVGWNDGRSQNWMFTDMDWSVSAGAAVNGWSWERWSDTVGVGVHVGGLSGPHRRYREAGGSGFVVGRSAEALRYAPEAVVEAYYDVEFAAGLNGALSLQAVFNPGYDAARGPVAVAAVRLRAAF